MAAMEFQLQQANLGVPMPAAPVALPGVTPAVAASAAPAALPAAPGLSAAPAGAAPALPLPQQEVLCQCCSNRI